MPTFSYQAEGGIKLLGDATIRLPLTQKLLYSGTGGPQIIGCAGVRYEIFIDYKFGEGSVVYLKHKALKGVLEQVAIKKVILVQNRKTFMKMVFLYQDTLNGIYNEDELLTQQDAIDLAVAYHETQKAEAIKAIKQCR